MEINELERLRVYLGDTQRAHGKLVYEAVVQAALEKGLAGATAFKGIMGFGGHHHIHTTKILQLSEDLPIVVEIIDIPANIDAFLPVLEGLVTQGLVTRDPVHCVLCKLAPVS